MSKLLTLDMLARAFEAEGVDSSQINTLSYGEERPAVLGAATVSDASPAEVAAARWSIETTIEEGKGETGLDEYEVRYWHSWHRHITLSIMAHTWLASVRHQATDKKGGLNPSWPN